MECDSAAWLLTKCWREALEFLKQLLGAWYVSSFLQNQQKPYLEQDGVKSPWLNLEKIFYRLELHHKIGKSSLYLPQALLSSDANSMQITDLGNTMGAIFT